MSLNASMSISVSAGGVSVQANVQRSDEGAIGQATELPAAKTGTLTTRTDDNTGVATLAGGHGIITSDVVDLYWSGGRRYGMTATVAGNAVTVDGGAGDALPVETTALTVSKVTTITRAFDGDNASLVALQSTLRSSGKSCVRFVDGGSAVLKVVDLINDEPFVWWDSSSVTNPLTGNAVATIVASNGSSSAATTLKICLVDNNVS